MGALTHFARTVAIVLGVLEVGGLCVLVAFAVVAQNGYNEPL